MYFTNEAIKCFMITVQMLIAIYLKFNNSFKFVFLNKVVFMKYLERDTNYKRKKKNSIFSSYVIQRLMKKYNVDTKEGIFLSSLEEDALLSAAKIASSKAVRTSMALGITIKIIRSREIIAINSDKSFKVLRKISVPQLNISSLRKGMILKRK